jgi:hypothetical protein
MRATVTNDATGVVESVFFTPAPREYTGIYVSNGRVRRVRFEAENEQEAISLAKAWNIGLQGPAQDLEVRPAPLPEAYPLSVAQKLLGGISRSSIYRDLHAGRLERMPHTRRVMITRRSIEARRTAD